MSNAFLSPFNISLCRVNTKKMSVPVETSTPKKMIAPAEIDHFHDISEICSPESEKKPIHMFDTPVFVFTKESEMWRRICLFSNNTQDVLYSNIRKLLLEDSFNEEQDVGVFYSTFKTSMVTSICFKKKKKIFIYVSMTV